MSAFIFLLVCLQLLSQTVKSEKLHTIGSESPIGSGFTIQSSVISESEAQSTKGCSSSTNMGYLTELETMGTPVKSRSSLTTTNSETEHNLRDKSPSINPEKFFMVTEEKIIEMNPRTQEPLSSTTALAATVPNLMTPTRELTKLHNHDSSPTITPTVFLPTDQIQETISDPITKEVSTGNCFLYLNKFTKGLRW